MNAAHLGKVAGVLLPVIAVLAACTGGPGDPTGGTSTSGSALPPSGTSTSSSSSSSSGAVRKTSIDPNTYSKACTQDSDCDLCQTLNNCGGCCGFVSVNKAAIEADYAAVKAACSQPGAGGAMCNIACPQETAKCNGGQCGTAPQ